MSNLSSLCFSHSLSSLLDFSYRCFSSIVLVSDTSSSSPSFTLIPYSNIYLINFYLSFPFVCVIFDDLTLFSSISSRISSSGNFIVYSPWNILPSIYHKIVSLFPNISLISLSKTYIPSINYIPSSSNSSPKCMCLHNSQSTDLDFISNHISSSNDIIFSLSNDVVSVTPNIPILSSIPSSSSSSSSIDTLHIANTYPIPIILRLITMICPKSVNIYGSEANLTSIYNDFFSIINTYNTLYSFSYNLVDSQNLKMIF